MATLSGQATNEAWQDYEQHLIDVGFLARAERLKYMSQEEQERQRTMHKLAKMTYKQAYVAGATAKVSQDAERTKKAPRRKSSENRTIRSNTDRTMDGEILAQVINNNGHPMPLSKIILAMRSAGREHWNNKNASGFIKTAINDGHKIKKVAHGVYGFDWSVKQ